MENTETDVEEPHWVTKLFPPRFTVLDLVGDNITPWPPESVLVTEKFAAQRAERLKEIYYSSLREVQAHEKKKRLEKFEKNVVREYEEGTDMVSRPPSTRNAKKITESSSSPIQEDQPIWNAEEMYILREAMHQKDSEKQQLQIHLNNAQAAVERLQSERAQLEKNLSQKERELLRVQQENERRALHVSLLQREGLIKDKTVQAWLEEIQEKTTEVQNLTRELQKARSDILDQSLQNKELQDKLIKERQMQEDMHQTIIEKIKVEHEVVIQKMQRELETAEAELATEKQMHARNLNALELLRRHFANLPPQNNEDVLAANVGHIGYY
ncbi:coiled-coil domain-containing protein 160 homolog [Erpetoichthys calabaricus]|uniref:coiled-coil domain-containing protein 160 homolog n=1 Tax=Erpetoichthys calabaricus TaxID=27687 RepID=UPI0010A0C053|nr:coiled-coil domain-containing protein 160 homolog [Erpetoichthys calabaricus]